MRCDECEDDSDSEDPEGDDEAASAKLSSDEVEMVSSEAVESVSSDSTS